jgi:hypothetical protein
MGIEPSSGLRHHVELFEDISASESKKVQNESSTFSDSEQMLLFRRSCLRAAIDQQSPRPKFGKLVTKI